MPEWISAKERVPTNDEYTHGNVIVAYEDGCVRNGWFSEQNHRWTFTDAHGDALWWMPFPKHPDKEGGAFK